MSKDKHGDYSYLLSIIVETVPNKKDKQFIEKNMDELVDKLIDFSKLVQKVIAIGSSKSSETEKLKQLKALSFDGYHMSQKEAREVVKMLSKTKVQAGGDAKALLKDVAKGMAANAASNAANQFLANNPKLQGAINSPLTQALVQATPQGRALSAVAQQVLPQQQPQQVAEEIPPAYADVSQQQPPIVYQQAPQVVYQPSAIPPVVQQFAQIPQQAIQYANMAQQVQQQNPSGIMSSFMGLFGMANLVYNDYASTLDWVYILLFLLAQIPFVGFIPNAVIIFRALKDGRTFLAILNTITTFFSIFTLHTIDMGFAIKAIYALDVYSNAKYPNK